MKIEIMIKVLETLKQIIWIIIVTNIVAIT